MHKVLILFSSVFIAIYAGKSEMDFDIDYYFSPVLRSTDSCSNLSKMYCQINCGKKNGVCIDGKCYCFSFKEASVESSLQRPEEEDKALQFYALRPTLRHHIAHFCPNLESARACIRKCMVEGKPAFCGKDHVCYCGHRYKNTDVDPKVDAMEVHNQFKDLYAKYFGPNTNSKKKQIASEETEV